MKSQKTEESTEEIAMVDEETSTAALESQKTEETAEKIVTVDEETSAAALE